MSEERAAGTPGPVVSESRVYDISEEVSEREEPAHMRRCENDPAGPACKLSRRIDEMEKKMDKVKEEQTKLLAVLGFWKWALPVVAAAVGAFASVVGTLLRARHGG